jgi:hypothetical protein
LANNQLEITQEFNKMVDEIVKLTETSSPSPQNERGVQAG